MHQVVLFIAILCIGELVATLIFRFALNPRFKINQTPASIAEGVMERLFLFLCFVNGIHIALVFFGALKIATHVNPHDNPPNEGKSLPKLYYLMGNLLSATFAVLYEIVWRYGLGQLS